MDFASAAELQQLLEGVGLPAERRELVSYAARQDASIVQLEALRALPSRLYRDLDEVGEALVPVQPRREDEVPHSPREESGAPPGGDEYLNPRPESGRVRDLDAVSGG